MFVDVLNAWLLVYFIWNIEYNTFNDIGMFEHLMLSQINDLF